MGYKLGACKGCKERREALAKVANIAKQHVSRIIDRKPKGQK